MSKDQRWNGGFCFGGGGGDQTGDLFWGVRDEELIGVGCRKMNGLGGFTRNGHMEVCLKSILVELW